MFLTIILTVYNKEPYLRRILKSLLSQEDVSKDEYEVLVVNDGSTDSSAAIIDEYQSDIRVLTQNNQGLSMARNNGMSIAKGDYIWFVDADDDITHDAVKHILDASKYSPDVIPIYARTDSVDKIRNAVNCNVKTGIDILTTSKWEQCGVFYVYRKSFLKKNNLSFLSGIYHEDAEFTPRMLYFAQSVKVVPKVLYTVYRVPASITQIPRSKRAFDYLTVSERLSKFVVDNGENKTKVGKAFANSIAQDINNAFYIISKNSANDQRQLNERFYQSRRLLIYMLSIAMPMKYRIEAFLFRLFPHNYVCIYKFMQGFNR